MIRRGRRLDSRPVSIGATRVCPETTDPPPATNPVEATWEALSSVYDPELCLDLVSLGLVYAIREEPGSVVVEMTLTTEGCPASESLPEMARAAIAERLGGRTAVEVRVVWDPPWTPAKMSGEAAFALGFRAR